MDAPAESTSSPEGRTEVDPMTEEQLAEAKRYSGEELKCNLADKAIDLLFLSVVALMLARPLDNWLRESLGLENLWLRLAAMYLVVTCAHFCVSFPLSFYSGHLLEHKYGLSHQTFRAWLWRYTKGIALTLTLGLLLTEGLYLVIFATHDFWWLAAAAAFFVVSIVLGQLAPVLIFPLFYKIEPLDDDQIGKRMEKLAGGTGLSIEGVYRMQMSEETAKANAMLAGLGTTRRVIMGDTLLDGFTHDEIDVVFAHEIGHHVHRHLRSMLVMGLVFSMAGFFLCHWIISSWWVSSGWTRELHEHVYVWPMLMLITTLFLFTLAPIQNAISRHFERQSDRYALQRTGNPQAYRSAFTKLAKLNKDDPDPHPLEVFWLHSHPPISKRLAMADEVSAVLD
ncbi:MAG: hypothetical protein CMJ81_14150 [Planctomycetaceae bacterium]|nr:hypothetical protein [Planctomycetaceae bacterium]MBP61531.1 hypothetical protein [Planctomycetaceae bacterium]